MKKVLLIEDNEDLSIILTKKLELSAYQVTALKSGFDIVTELMQSREPPHAMILDIMLPDRSGYDLLNSIKCKWPETKIFVFSAHREYGSRIPKDYIEGFFCKADGIDRLIAALESAFGGPASKT